ncbi:MAG: hypothetical protein J6T72_00005, partial [Alphaproteobacteria bacterium]|nr:hypothetical protein [Alphaproteobacteria bacterium]
MTENTEIINISQKEMADYFSRAFSNSSFKKMIREEESLYRAETLFQKFGNILQAYASATEDLSDKTIDVLANDMMEHKDILFLSYDDRRKISADQNYFGQYVMPKIINLIGDKMGLKEPHSVNDLCNIMAEVATNCKNNKFLTHSFNGALLPSIKQNGLDISKEMFIDEYALLSSAKMEQPYHKGNLLFCELSKATFGYSLGSPERLRHSLTSYNRKQQNDQSTNEFLTLSLQDRLDENKTLSDAEKQKVFAAGKKMIDFYYGKTNKSAIAFIKPETEYERISPEKIKQRLCRNLSYSSYKNPINSFLTEKGDSELSEKYATALENFNKNENTSGLISFIDDFNAKYPENTVIKDKVTIFAIKDMTEFGLNNFEYNGFADGHKIEGGKMSPEQFSIAEFENPVDVFI